MNNKTHQIRSADRVKTELPVTINGVQGITRDVRASGIFLEVDSPAEPGSTIEFLVKLDSPTGKLTFSCEGEVVRIEEFEKKYGIATKVLSMYLVPLLDEQK